MPLRFITPKPQGPKPCQLLENTALWQGQQGHQFQCETTAEGGHNLAAFLAREMSKFVHAKPNNSESLGGHAKIIVLHMLLADDALEFHKARVQFPQMHSIPGLTSGGFRARGEKR